MGREKRFDSDGSKFEFLHDSNLDNIENIYDMKFVIFKSMKIYEFLGKVTGKTLKDQTGKAV